MYDNELSRKLTNFINNKHNIFRIGGSKSRGLGKVKIKAQLDKPNNTVKQRIKDFNSKLQERFQNWSNVFTKVTNNPFENECKFFTINLHSEAVLIENWQRTTVISKSMLKQFTGIEDESLELHVAYSSYDYRSGWNSAWGLMKDVELVTNKGAVYLFSTEDIKSWYDALFILELTGVGERYCEGFGLIEICNEFHLVFRENPA